MNPIPLLGYDLTDDRADDSRPAVGIGNGLVMGILLWLVVAVVWVAL